VILAFLLTQTLAKKKQNEKPAKHEQIFPPSFYSKLLSLNCHSSYSSFILFIRWQGNSYVPAPFLPPNNDTLLINSYCLFLSIKTTA